MFLYLTIVDVSDFSVVIGRRVKVGHKGGNVLSGSQPGVHVVTGVEESASGDGDVGHLVSVKGKLEG